MKKTYSILIISFIFASCNLSRTNYVFKDDAMLPTIKAGDHIKIKKDIDSLTYGDIVVFEFIGSGDYEKINGHLVSRIVALPDDSIAVEKDICIVNGKKNSCHILQSLEYNDVHTEQLPNNQKLSIFEYEEQLPNDLMIRIYSDGHDPVRHDTYIQPSKVPDNHYYILSDNRSIAIDSRNFGSIDKKKIKGKVIKIIAK